MRISAFVVLVFVAALGLGRLAAQSPLQLPPPPGGAGAISEILLPGNGGGFAGLAALDPLGRPVIYYDGIWMDRIGGLGSAAFRFTRAHEYGHHQLGHVVRQFTTPPAQLPALGYESELEADCWAVRVLAAGGDQAAVEAGYNVYRNVLSPHDANGRPGAWRRIARMDVCLGRRAVATR